jgi:hypothetical protein
MELFQCHLVVRILLRVILQGQLPIAVIKGTFNNIDVLPLASSYLARSSYKYLGLQPTSKTKDVTETLRPIANLRKQATRKIRELNILR